MMARLPLLMVNPSSTSAISTKSAMISAVKNSPIANAESSAMVMESSIVILR